MDWEMLYLTTMLIGGCIAFIFFIPISLEDMFNKKEIITRGKNGHKRKNRKD